MQSHPICRFEDLEATFHKCYQKLQIDEQVYMALRVIKQNKDKKVEIYYEHILN
jgi:metal-sulfur cluster biosynthetic enzyme